MSPKKKQKPLTYFLSQISPYGPLKAACPSCETTTNFSSHIHLSTSEGSIHINYYQCQSCGKLDSSDAKDLDGIRVGLENKCECGGQFRSDKNIFCPNCQYRKSEENKAGDKLFANEEEIESLSMRHGVEEMPPGFYGQKDESETEEVEEESNTKKIIKALRELTKDGSSYKFGFEVGGKGGSHFFDKGLDDDIEFLLYAWMMQELAEKSKYNSTDYEVTCTDSGIKIDCFAYWDNGEYEDAYYSYEDIFNQEIVNLLLPDQDYDNFNFEGLILSFEYMNDDSNTHFFWNTDTINYHDEENEKNIEIRLYEIKTELEKLLHDSLSDLDSGGRVTYRGQSTKTVTVQNGEVKVSENAGFHLSFDIDDY